MLGFQLLPPVCVVGHKEVVIGMIDLQEPEPVVCSSQERVHLLAFVGPTPI